LTDAGLIPQTGIESGAVLWRHCQPIGDHNGIERPQLLACQSPAFACFRRLSQLAKISVLRTFNGRYVPGAVPPPNKQYITDRPVIRTPENKPSGVFLLVRPAGRVARKRNWTGCGGQPGDLEVQVLYTPGKGKC